MNIIHVNSYYYASKFYKNLYDIQNQTFNLKVYVPIKYTDNKNNFDYGQYSILSEVFSAFDRLFFYKKHTQILHDIEKKINISEYDIIHAHSLFSNGYIAYKLYEKYKIPYIVAIRNADYNVFFKKMPHLRKVGEKILENAKKIIFISEHMRKKIFKEWFFDKKQLMYKSTIIPNGISNFWFKNQLDNKLINKTKSTNLIQVANLNKNKNQKKALESVKILNEKMDTRITFVGKTENKKIKELISNSIFSKYEPFVKPKELLSLYRSNDIFMMPSYTETFGLVYIEAMSQGLPIIYSKNQGVDGFFRNGTVGFRVDPKDPYDISKHIQKILTNYEEMSRNAIKESRNFDWQAIKLKYDEIYFEILEK